MCIIVSRLSLWLWFPSEDFVEKYSNDSSSNWTKPVDLYQTIRRIFLNMECTVTETGLPYTAGLTHKPAKSMTTKAGPKLRAGLRLAPVALIYKIN